MGAMTLGAKVKKRLRLGTAPSDFEALGPMAKETSATWAAEETKCLLFGSCLTGSCFLFNQLITRFFSSLDGSDVSLVSSMPVVCVTACCE